MNLQDLSDRTGISVRTIRFYITERLLPGPEGRGTSTSYGDEHLGRLLLIRELSSQRLPLSEIRERLAQVSPSDLPSMLAEVENRSRAEETTRSTSPKEYLSSMLEQALGQRSNPELFPAPAERLPRDVWRRIRLGAGIELHVTPEAERVEGELIERIQDLAKDGSKNRKRRNTQ